MSEWVCSIGAMTVTGKSEADEEKTVPVPLLSTTHTSVATCWHNFVKIGYLERQPHDVILKLSSKQCNLHINF